MENKDTPCVCGHNRWKTIKKKKIWQCRNRSCGMVRDIEVDIMKAQRADALNMASRLRKVFA